MNKRLILLFLAFVLSYGLGYGQCGNGDFETGDFTGWRGFTGRNIAGVIDVSALTPGFVPGSHDLMTVAEPNDTYGGFPKRLDGNFALRLGSGAASGKCQVASITMLVTSSNAKFSFSYALVLQDPGTSHVKVEKPFFEYWISKTIDIKKSKSPFEIITQKKFFADVADPFSGQAEVRLLKSGQTNVLI